MSQELDQKLFKLAGGEEFAAAVRSLSLRELNARISQMQKDLSESVEHKEQNEELKRAKEEVKELSGPYNDVSKAIKIKTKFIIELIKEKGGQ